MKESAEKECDIAGLAHRNQRITYLAIPKRQIYRFCKQRLPKYGLVSTVSVYNISGTKNKRQSDQINTKFQSGVLREYMRTVQRGYIKSMVCILGSV